MDDLRLELRTRNNRLWHLIFDTSSNIAEWCRTNGVSNTEVGGFLNLTRSPYLRDGMPRPIAEKVADVAKMLVEDLFPKDLYSGQFPNRIAAEIPSKSYRGLASARRLALPPMQETGLLRAEMQAAIRGALDTLTPRENKVLRMRFGLDDDGEELSLRAAGRELGVSVERVRQIEAKALRKLRHPDRSRKLRSYIDIVAEPVVKEAKLVEETNPVPAAPVPAAPIYVYVSQDAVQSLLQEGQALLESLTP